MKLVLVFALCSAALLTGCNSTRKSMSVADLPEKGKVVSAKAGTLQDQTQRVINAAYRSQQNDGSPYTASANVIHLRYFEEGVLASNMLLNAWFDSHLIKDKKFNHNRTLVNIIGTGAIGVMGLTGSEAKELALVGLGLAGFNAEFDNYASNYLISPVLAEVQKKIDDARKKYLAEIEKSLKAETRLSSAKIKIALIDYHKLGSRTNIEYIVKTSVGIAKYAPLDTDKEKHEKERFEKLSALHAALTGNPGALSPETAQALYVIVYGAANKDDEPFKSLRLNVAYAPYVTKYDGLGNKSVVDELLLQLSPLVGGQAALNEAQRVLQETKDEEAKVAHGAAAIAKASAAGLAPPAPYVKQAVAPYLPPSSALKDNNGTSDSLYDTLSRAPVISN